MELLKLEQHEHGKTRDLWERVFEEDSKVFLDYYYFFKTRDNEIYVIEEDGDIRSMLQLNPYTIQVEEERFAGNYIIAVATEETYRKRGYMGHLLRHSMQEMYKQKELFAFLMPAAESIYLPYDFRFVYDQNVCVYTVRNQEETAVVGIFVTEAGIGDGAALADFFNIHFANQFQVYAVRDENYYQTLFFEQQSEKGGIRILKKNGAVIGCFLYGDEERLEIREPLYLKEYETEFWNAVNELCVERRQESAAVYAGIEMDNTGENHKKPTIMARIIHLESLLKTLKVKEGEEINCSFAVLDAILPQNSRVWKLVSTPELSVKETEDSEGVLSIAALTSLLFGYKTVREIEEEPDVYLTEHLKEELQKIQPLNHIYLNEIV